VDSHKGSVYNTRTAPSSTKHYTRAVCGGNATTGDEAQQKHFRTQTQLPFLRLDFTAGRGKRTHNNNFPRAAYYFKVNPFLLLEPALFVCFNNNANKSYAKTTYIAIYCDAKTKFVYVVLSKYMILYEIPQ
jgi:hypothetical protein